MVPLPFWFLSITGALIVLTYGIHKAEPVLIVGQSTGLFVYSRNLWLIYREKRRSRGEESAGDVERAHRHGHGHGEAVLTRR